MFIDSRRICIFAIISALLLLSSATFCPAGVYKCLQPDGSIRFTNAPSSAGCSEFIRERKRRPPRVLTPSNSSYSASSYDQAIWISGTRYNVDPYLIKAVIRAESDFDSRAVSRKGAQGLMQLMPETARELRVQDPFDPHQNIDGGTRYLRQMLDTFNNDLLLSLAAYNAGPGAVKRANGVPRFPETLRYVTKVLKHYKSYRNQAKG